MQRKTRHSRYQQAHYPKVAVANAVQKTAARAPARSEPLNISRDLIARHDRRALVLGQPTTRASMVGNGCHELHPQATWFTQERCLTCF
jgi:hypothetical protein